MPKSIISKKLAACRLADPLHKPGENILPHEKLLLSDAPLREVTF
jgi:hypothetical protein